MNPSRLWPLAIVGVLALTVGANGWVLYEANRDPNGTALESDYYRKAVAYDSSLAQARADSALGWRLDVVPGRFSPSGTALALALVDRAGVPIGGARVGVVAIHNLEGGRERSANGTTGPDGRALLRLPLGRAGWWELRFEVLHAAGRFTSDVRLDVAGAAR